MGDPLKTVLHAAHLSLGATMVDFGGWHMPMHYKHGIVEEHLATRAGAGLFDVSHMGRFLVRGEGAVGFLQHVLSNNAAALETGFAQYTMIPNERGGALDDAYLYRLRNSEYLLVVNAANRATDWRYLQGARSRFPGVELQDLTEDMAMLSLQGPRSQEILQQGIAAGVLPGPRRNVLTVVTVGERPVVVARTGYTGEPIGFECFVDADAAPGLWDVLLEKGAIPVGLGARDTLRLEAGLPLFGHELGKDPDGEAVPIFSCPLARFAVSFSPLKGAFVGREALARQAAAFQRMQAQENGGRFLPELPRALMPFAVRGKGIARAGFPVYRGDDRVGLVTSGTMVPYWKMVGEDPAWRFTGERAMRAIGLMLVDRRLRMDEAVCIDIRGRRVEAGVVPRHLRSAAPPYAVPVVAGENDGRRAPPSDPCPARVPGARVLGIGPDPGRAFRNRVE